MSKNLFCRYLGSRFLCFADWAISQGFFNVQFNKQCAVLKPFCAVLKICAILKHYITLINKKTKNKDARNFYKDGAKIKLLGFEI